MGYEIIKKEDLFPKRIIYRKLATLLYFKRILNLVSGIEGDIVECGVHRGTTLCLWASLVKEEMKGRKIWAFDSFQGFPEPSSFDRGIGFGQARKGFYSDTSVERVRQLLLDIGLDQEFVDSQVTIVKGFFSESLKKYKGTSIAILFIDADLYSSYKDVLEMLYPKVAKGGVVLMDEYMGTFVYHLYPGANKAVDEFFGEKAKQIQRDKISGMYYLIK